MDTESVNDNQIDLILSSVAALFEPTAPQRSVPLTDADLRTILRRPMNISQGSEGFMISSSRDQIEVQVGPNKIDVRELSGEIDNGKSKIPRIINGLGGLLQLSKIQTYGINFIVEVAVERPHEWIGDNLLNKELAARFGTSTSSNLITLVLDHPPAASDPLNSTWTVRFEARPGGRLNVNFNASRHIDKLPEDGQLGVEVGAAYEAMTRILAQLETQAG